MPDLELSDVRGVRSLADALDFARRLGYQDGKSTLDLPELGLPGFSGHYFLRTGKKKREGYGVLVGEMNEIPRSLASLGRGLRALHDHPLAIIGTPGADGEWTRFVVVRPRLVKSGNGFTFRTGKMDVDIASPTRHDCEVLGQLAWDPRSANPQTEVDKAFDIEAITRRFFSGLRRHFDAIEAGVSDRAKADPAVHVGVKEAGGARRVAIRLISQVIFCFFLQRKGLLASDRHYLVTLWNKTRLAKRHFHDALEDLFYETLSKPVASRDQMLAHANVPFLNGGLFERAYGDVRLGLADALFDLEDGLLGFLTRWTFTLHEEAPDESDVAIDPELLGRVFEHLVSDEEQVSHGVVYTPRPVVQFMCRESLIAWLGDQNTGLSEEQLRAVLSESEPLERLKDELGTERAAEAFIALNAAVQRVTVLDPAVGSGAFLLGMLGEVVRIRQLVQTQMAQRHASPAEIHDWKLHCIENSLFGVDIEPLALELCRLRLWLSLIVEIDVGGTVQPLPNLEYRTVAGNSLSDFVGGIEVQTVRRGQGTQQSMDLAEVAEISKSRDAFFGTTDPSEKSRLRKTISEQEGRLVERVLALASGKKSNASKKAFLDTLSASFRSRDRVFPIFMPAFHFPETYSAGGWDIVIMNPPYLGRKEVARRLLPAVQEDYRQHFGETNDLLVLFGIRMLDFVKPSGIGAMIGNDSFLTSTDGFPLRHILTQNTAIRVLARTDCFEGQAVNGAVVVWHNGASTGEERFHWVEAYKRDLRDFAGATLNAVQPRERIQVGALEILAGHNSDLWALPNRAFFRPSSEALECLEHYGRIVPEQFRTSDGWDMLSRTPRLKKAIQIFTETGVYDRLRPGQFVPLGICIEGGQGLATADDRRFLAVVQGTPEGDKCLADRKALLARIHADGQASAAMVRDMRAGMSEDDALLALAEDARMEKRLRFPRIVRTITRDEVFEESLTPKIIQSGLPGKRHFVAFEKGDRSGEDPSGTSVAARWARENPVVIDWSSQAVSLLRARYASTDTRHKPYFRNEMLWGKRGISWNSIARYLRARIVPANGIFGHKTPLIRPIVAWLDEYALLALLNTDTVEFILKTFLGSLMQIEVGDLRRLPVPVLSPTDFRRLSDFGQRAVRFTTEGKSAQLVEVEGELNRFVRGLYGISADAALWVTR